MARSYFQCAECGADIAVYGRNRDDADRLAGWHESNRTLCRECQEKQHAVENAEAAKINAAANLPPLTGSQKQIAWAETLRAKIFRRINRATAENAEASLKSLDVVSRSVLCRDIEDIKRMRNAKIGSRLIETFFVVLHEQTKASWWIESAASCYLLDLMTNLMAQIKARIRAALLAKEPTKEQVEAEEEALLKPQGDLASEHIALIKLQENAIQVIFPVKIEAFRTAMRGLGFKWTGEHWSRELNFRHGTPSDRMAETAHRLLAQGFLVRIYDDEARAKALRGDFESERRRWIVWMTAGDFAGWFKIEWPRDDDFYAVSRRLLGSRYKAGHVYVPLGSAEEVLDFAERYGFSLSTGATEAIGRHQAAIEAGAVVIKIKKPPLPKKGETDIPTLGASPCSVASDLADN